MSLVIYQDILLIIFILTLILTFILGVFLIILVLRLIKISTKLKAKQFSKFNDFANKGEIIFLGDSLTEFYQIEEFFHGYPIYNRGIASDTTDGVLARLDSNVIALQPKKVFLQIGTNDFRKKNEHIFRNIVQIIERLKSDIEGVQIYVISLYPINHKARVYTRFFTMSRSNKKIMELNDMLIQYCKENNLKYIDVYNKLIDKDGNLEKQYTTEGLHISFEGYKIITNILKPYIEE